MINCKKVKISLTKWNHKGEKDVQIKTKALPREPTDLRGLQSSMLGVFPS